MRWALKSTSTNAAEFNAGLDDVFTGIAGRYDRLCDVFSLLAHRRASCPHPTPASQERGPDSPHGLSSVDPSLGHVLGSAV